MSPDLRAEVARALHDAERWIGKYCADNDHIANAGHPVFRARKALTSVAATRAKLGSVA